MTSGTSYADRDVVALPADSTLQTLGLVPSAVTAVTLLQQQRGHVLYRLTYGEQSFVLKWFAESTHTVELHAYTLLAQLGVPTLPVYRRTTNALLLEDLATSQLWRLATEADMQREATGVAVADWYRMLHTTGWTLFAITPVPQWLFPREVDMLDAAVILSIGQRLQLPAHPVWQLAAEHIEVLKQAIHAMPTTLTYNDFHWTNLALSRDSLSHQHALIFDYHLLGIGMRASDYRNVSGALGEAARAAFQSQYGTVDEREAVLDAPVAVLYALQQALRWPQLPRWALSIVDEVTTGRLEAKLRRAIAVI
jgi:hypothetical protein